MQTVLTANRFYDLTLRQRRIEPNLEALFDVRPHSRNHAPRPATALAAQRPNAIRAAALIDIGPEVTLDGLKRIAGYASVMEAPESWTEAAFKLRLMNERDFPTLSGDDWYIQARRTFAEKNGAPKLDYDPKIGVGLRKGLEAANVRRA